jgi:hypothetical protein
MSLLRDIAEARRLARGRLEQESAKLDPVEEQAIAEGDIGEAPTSDPQDY